MRRLAGVATIAVLAACEGMPGGTPAPRGADRTADAPVRAPANQGCDALVPIEAADTAEGVARERAWLAENYPGAQVLAETKADCDGVPADRVVFLHEGVQNTVLFDTSSFYGRVGGDDLDELLDG